jgi:hypothetical protein
MLGTTASLAHRAGAAKCHLPFAVSALVILQQSCYISLQAPGKSFAGRPFCYEKAETGGKRKNADGSRQSDRLFDRWALTGLHTVFAGRFHGTQAPGRGLSGISVRPCSFFPSSGIPPRRFVCRRRKDKKWQPRLLPSMLGITSFTRSMVSAAWSSFSRKKLRA